jgi:hypothetical protein
MRLTTYESDATADASFFSPFNWERSHKGNLWRYWHGKMLTVYSQGRWYGWCINDDGGTKYSDRMHETEADATNELYRVLLIAERQPKARLVVGAGAGDR